MNGMSEFAELITAAMGAVRALRSYQHGDSSRELAEEMADALEGAIRRTLEGRDASLRDVQNQLEEMKGLAGRIEAMLIDGKIDGKAKAEFPAET